MNDSVYRKQSNDKEDISTQTKKETSKLEDNNQAQHIVTDEDWEQKTRSLWNPMPQQPEIQEPEVEELYIMSLTPKAAQYPYPMNNKPCYYPSTPQEEGENPLQTYYDALERGKPFWTKHNGEVTYVVDKRDFSPDKNSLIVMSMKYLTEEEKKNILSSYDYLSKEDYENVGQRQISKVEYKDGLYIHKRISTGFFPKIYLDDWYDEKIGKKNNDK